MREGNSNTIADRVNSLSLTAAERKAARALLANYPTVGLDSVSRFAEKAQISHPTILRLIAKLGFSSYGDFQESLRDEIEDRFQTLPQRFDAKKTGRKSDSLLDQYADTVFQNVKSAFEMTSRSEIEAIVKLLADESRSVYLIGFALTYPLAAWFYNYWKIIRPDVHHIIPGTKHFTHILDMRRKDIVILFEMPRYEDRVTRFGEEVIRRGINLIVFTDDLKSPLASQARHVIAAPVSVPSLLDSYIGTVLQLELLTAVLIEKLGEKCRKRVTELEKLVPDWQKTLTVPPSISENKG